MASAAGLWGIAHQCAQTYPQSLHRAGIEGEGAALGETLFEEILSSPRGFVFAADELADSWSRLGGGEPRLGTDEAKVRLDLEDLFPRAPALWLPPSPILRAQSFRCFSPPVSVAPTPPTPSTVTRLGARAIRTVRFALRSKMPWISASRRVLRRS